jgi:transcriptional regulator with XRE-family HTH domain
VKLAHGGRQEYRFGHRSSVMTPKALRSIRLALGLSLRDFAQRINLPVDVVLDMERGRVPIDIKKLNPHLEQLSNEASSDSGSSPNE